LGTYGAVTQQKDNLCGPFHAARLLQDAGVVEYDGEPLDQDLVALQAGTVLPIEEHGPQVPPGATNLRDYRYQLTRAEQEQSGTSPDRLATAIEELSGGLLACVPLSGEWTGEAVSALVDGLDGPGTRLIANLRTGPLWGSRPPVDVLLAALDGVERPDTPEADWDAGHFVELVQLVRGRAGCLVVVQDSYPSLGWQGCYLQPPTALAEALMRGDGREGGVLAVTGPAGVPAVEELAQELALDTKMWKN
jgi:hypothetical protein